MKLQEFIGSMQPLKVSTVASMVGVVHPCQLPEVEAQRLAITDALGPQKLPGFHDLDLAAAFIGQRILDLRVAPRLRLEFFGSIRTTAF